MASSEVGQCYPCRIPVAVGAVTSVNRKLGARIRLPGYAYAHSIGKSENGESTNEMTWVGDKGCKSFCSHLVARSTAQPKKPAVQNLCYQAVWQVGVNFLSFSCFLLCSAPS